MKKIFKLIVLLFLCIVVSGCTNFVDILREKINKHIPNDNTIIIFYRDDCKYCNQLSEYLDSQDQSVKKQLRIKKYNINEEENRELFNQKIEELGLSSSKVGVPFIVIGDNYLIGFNKEKFNEFIFENLNITLTQKSISVPNEYQVYTYETDMTGTYASSFKAGDYMDIYLLSSEKEDPYICRYFEDVLIVKTNIDSSKVKLDLALNKDDFKRMQEIEKSERVKIMLSPVNSEDIFEEMQIFTHVTKEEMDEYIK